MESAAQAWQSMQTTNKIFQQNKTFFSHNGTGKVEGVYSQVKNL